MQKRRYMFRAKFHLSPIENITSIKHSGLLADRAKAGNARVWLCDWEQIHYIAQHLLDHHGFSSHRFMVYQVRHWNLPYPLRKHRDGIYYYIGNIPYCHMDPEFALTADNDVIQAIMARECAR